MAKTADAALDRGIALFNSGKPKESIPLFSGVIRSDRKNANARLFRAFAYLSVGRGNDALRDLKQMIVLKPGSAAYRLQAATVLRQMGRDAEACRECDEALALDPALPDAWLLKAEFALLVEDRKAALDCLRQAITLAPKVPALRIKLAQVLEADADYEGAEAEFKQAGAFAEVARLQVWRGKAPAAIKHASALHRGAAAVLQGKFPAALRELDQAIVQDARDAEPLVWRAEARRRMGKTVEAEHDLAAALRLQPYQLGAFLNLELLKLGRGQEVRDYIMSRVPKEVSDLKTELASGDGARSAAALERALKGMGGNRSGTNTFLWEGKLVRHIRFFPRDPLLEIQARLRFEEPERVVAELTEQVRRFPDQAYPYSHRGEVYLWLGRYDEAGEDFARARAFNKELLWPKIGGAAVHLFRGELGKTLHVLRKAGKYGGSESILLPWRVETYRRMGDFKKALETFKGMREPAPFRPAIWLNLALTRSSLGDSAGMIEILRTLETNIGDFLQEAASGAGVRWKERYAPAVCRRILESALDSMRGNRSRWMYTYFDSNGRFRLLRLRGVKPESAPPQLRGNTWQFLP